MRGAVHHARYVRRMYSVTLYCSDPACDAMFEAHGTLEAAESAICPFCGCCLGELTCVPVAEELAHADLELWVIVEPAGRRLRRRRRSRKRLPRAA
jgi:hypothetical protein